MSEQEAAVPAVVDPTTGSMAVPSLKEVALASFVAIESHMQALAKKYRDVAFDVTTTAGMAAAKAARNELREQGRYLVQRLETRLRDEANDLKRVLTGEAERVISLCRPVEDAIHAQIQAEEERREAEKQAKAKAEAERVAKLESSYQGMLMWVEHCTKPDMTSERVAAGIKILEDLEIGDGWQEYRARAEDRKAAVIASMRAHYEALLAREAEAERLKEAAREADRVAQAQADEARRLEAERDAIRQQQEQFAASQRRIREIESRVEAIRSIPRTIESRVMPIEEIEGAIWALQEIAIDEASYGSMVRLADMERESAIRELKEMLSKAKAAQDAAPPADEHQAQLQLAVDDMDIPARNPDPEEGGVPDGASKVENKADEPKNEPNKGDPDEPTINGSEITRRLGFALSSAFIAKLGFGGRKAGPAVVWQESDWPKIKAALIEHIAKA